MSPARLLPRLLLAAAATLLALVLGEGLLALADRGSLGLVSPLRVVGDRIGADITVPDDDLLVRLRPLSTFLGYYRINERGWRGGPVAEELADDVRRIVCVGDSCTFGYGLDEQDAWPSQLQRLLDVAYAGVAAFDVVNTGIPGYSTWQNRLQVERQLPGLEADLVVLLPSGHNDITGALRFPDAERTAYNHSWQRRLEETRWYRTLDQTFAGASVQTVMATPPPGPPDAPWRVSPEATRENLAAMARAVADQGAAALLLVPAHREDAHRRTPAYGEHAERVAAAARALDLPALDLRPAFAAWAPAEPFIDPVHPDERGSAEIAWAVFRWLVAEGVLVPEHPRTAWLAAWLEARAGDRTEQNWLATGDGPPLLERARVRLRQAGPTREAFLTEPSPLAPEVRRLDPLHGSQRWQQLPGWVDLLARLAARLPDPATAAKLAERATQLAAHRIPRTSQGVEALALEASPDTLADVRALLVLEALLRGPARPMDERLALAERAFESGDGEGALELLGPVEALLPDDPAVPLLRGQVLRRLGRHDEAGQAFARAIELDPDSPEAQTLQARAEFKAGRLDEAEQRLRAVLAQAPNHAQAHYLLGRLCLLTDRPAEAWRELGAARAFSFLGQFPDLGDLVGQLLAEHPELARGGAARE